MLLFGLASSFLWPETLTGLCWRELVGSAEQADKEACVPLLPLLAPKAPRPQGFGGSSVSYRTRVSAELLSGFKMVTTPALGPLFDISELYPFCHLGQKCTSVASDKTLSNQIVRVRLQ